MGVEKECEERRSASRNGASRERESREGVRVDNKV